MPMETLVSAFLTAFENLDMPAFMACFAQDATMFFPTPEPPQRFHGKAAIERKFGEVFARIRAEAHAGPPFHRLRAEDLLVQRLSPEAGLVSFHLRSNERIARRTLVLSHSSAGWLIHHLHASNVSYPAPAPQGT